MGPTYKKKINLIISTIYISWLNTSYNLDLTKQKQNTNKIVKTIKMTMDDNEDDDDEYDVCDLVRKTGMNN